MGLLPRIKERYQFREVRFVNERGRKVGGFSTDTFVRLTNGRFTSLPRSDLSALIYSAIEGDAETPFGDSIVGIEVARKSLILSGEMSEWSDRAAYERSTCEVGSFFAFASVANSLPRNYPGCALCA